MGIQTGSKDEKNQEMAGLVTWACRQDLTAAKAAIEELFGKIREVRRKAEASEVMVQEICRDIRKLDFAKTHLTHTITALRRLAMLVNAVGESLGQARAELGPFSTKTHPTHPFALLCRCPGPSHARVSYGQVLGSPLGHHLRSQRKLQAAAGTCCLLQTLCCT